MTDPDIPTYFLDLPVNVSGLCCINEDGDPTIYLNARQSRDQNYRTFRHELEHFRRDDFHSDAPIEEIEGGSRFLVFVAAC